MDATNQHIMKQVQNVLKEKSNKIKDILTIALKADIEQLQKAQKVSRCTPTESIITQLVTHC